MSLVYAVLIQIVYLVFLLALARDWGKEKNLLPATGFFGHGHTVGSSSSNRHGL